VQGEGGESAVEGVLVELGLDRLRGEKSVTWVLQECYMGCARVLQECRKSVTRVLQECCKSVASVLQKSCKSVTRPWR
jgi:hypothetical protein